MKRILPLATLFGLALTGAAAAAPTAEISVLPVNGTCPTGFELNKATAGADDSCVQVTGGMSGSGSISMASFSGGEDDEDHGHNDHDSDSD
jgi:hypothetical protein